MNYVIIGNGPTGVVAAENLRKSDSAGNIILIGDEPEPPYSRMALPYLLVGNIQESGTYLRKEAGHFEKLRIQLKNARVTQVNTTSKQLVLSDGQILAYDKLLIATGSRPVAPPIPGMDLPGGPPFSA